MAPETAYPFVVDVVLSTATEQDTNVVGTEPVTFTVTYNRDMDQAIQPAVSFGPATPFTDYRVQPVNGGWVNTRMWQGNFNVNPITGDGYQLIRVAGAVAADDPWLVTGDDSERFRFEIITSGTESMNLQGNGGEGYIDLTWTQTDFDLLAGFNLYKATSPNGSYTRLNSTIIPPDQRSWRDTDVTPGQPYFYKFTIVKSDMSESDFSNIATATPLDTIAPVITHTPLSSATPGLPLTLFTDVTDNVAVQTVKLFFRAIGSNSYIQRSMTRTTGNRYSVTVEGTHLVSPGIEYYIEAGDGVGIARAGRADLPYQIAVMDKPVVTTISPNQGPAGGGAAVTIRGTNFKAGATVTLGGAACSPVQIVSSSEIRCTTPLHFPEVVDVRVTNIDGQLGNLLRGFTYLADRAALGLPATGGGQQDIVQVPINAANVQGLAAADLTVTFDSTVLAPRTATTGNLTPGWSLGVNTTTPGQMRLSMAAAGGTVSGSGVLANLEFEVLGSAGVTTTLHLAALSLNDGAIPADVADGLFTVSLTYSVAGQIRYWQGATSVPSVTLSLVGDRLYAGASNAQGDFQVTGVRQDSYTLTPDKN
ncbi:MAG: IPT/TIG domain-containing protein, partial [Caldilineaceae bacterium]